MLLTDFTSYDEIRTAAGLSSDELPDSELAVELYVNSLELALNSVDLPAAEPGPGPLASRFLTIKAITAINRTAAQQKLYNLTRLFSAYAVAAEINNTLSMRAPKSLSDSKASSTRFSSDATFKDAVEKVLARLADLRSQLERINETTVEVLPYFTVVSSSTNPITGA